MAVDGEYISVNNLYSGDIRCMDGETQKRLKSQRFGSFGLTEVEVADKTIGVNVMILAMFFNMQVGMSVVMRVEIFNKIGRHECYQ